MSSACDKELLKTFGYKLVTKIGQGGFSSVYKVVKRLNNVDHDFAVKVLKFKERSVVEIEVLKTLKHENIIRYVDHFNNSSHIYLVMEYCDEGDLETFILKRHKLAESLVKIIMQQLALAMHYLQMHDICHMDIKPKNVLVTSKPRLTFKLSDFGIAENITSEYMERCRENGTMAYMAPEKLTGKKYDMRSDLWSLGVVMYQCIYGKPSHFYTAPSNLKNLITKEVHLPIPANSHISSTCEDLLRRLLKYNPDDRIKFADFYKHPFIDLSNMPSNENYFHVVKVINDAVALDSAKKHEEALRKYSEAIALLQPYLETETNHLRKEKLHAKYWQYTKRVAELQGLLSDRETQSAPVPAPDFSKDLLMKLASSTPKLKTGLEIGNVAEEYLLDGKRQLAFENITEALNLLITLYANEPTGHRKTLLFAQIERWLVIAEDLKRFPDVSE